MQLKSTNKWCKVFSAMQSSSQTILLPFKGFMKFGFNSYLSTTNSSQNHFCQLLKLHLLIAEIKTRKKTQELLTDQKYFSISLLFLSNVCILTLIRQLSLE